MLTNKVQNNASRFIELQNDRDDEINGLTTETEIFVGKLRKKKKKDTRLNSN